MTQNTHKFEFKLGRTGLILFITGVSVLLFGVFLLGVTVGKNIDTYPERIARYLPERIKTFIGLSPEAAAPVMVARGDPQQEKQEPGMDLTFYDTLGKRKGETKGMTPDGMFVKKTPPGEIKEASPPPAPATPALQPPVPAPVSANPKAPPVMEKAATKGKFSVQVVSYREKKKAKALVNKISALGYSARTEMTELPDRGKWHRVWMGEFPSRAEAQKAVDAVSIKFKGLNCVIRSAEGTGD